MFPNFTIFVRLKFKFSLPLFGFSMKNAFKWVQISLLLKLQFITLTLTFRNTLTCNRLKIAETWNEKKEKREKKNMIKGSQMGAFCLQTIVYCYLEFKLRYLEKLKLFSIRVKELFEPTVLWKRAIGFLLAFVACSKSRVWAPAPHMHCTLFLNPPFLPPWGDKFLYFLFYFFFDLQTSP